MRVTGKVFAVTGAGSGIDALGAYMTSIIAAALLAALVRARAPFVALRVVEADEIDARVERGELNLLERECAAALIAQAPGCARIIADGARMFAPLREQFPQLRAYDRGESRHCAVATARSWARAATGIAARRSSATRSAAARSMAS